MKQYEIGALVSCGADLAALEKDFERLASLELNACQLNVWPGCDLSEAAAETICAAAKKNGIRITAVWAGWSGPAVWDFYEGPKTLGIVPEAYREKRVSEIKAEAAFARLLGVTDVITHLGFLPEDPNSPNFQSVADTIADLANELKVHGQWFLFETGQETPVTMLRFIEEVHTGNLGINLDTANLILYGKANTADALDVFGRYVRNTHFKDGFYPTSGRSLGRECALGDGKANVPCVIAGLKACGYTGPYIIEREITGEQQTKDIAKARDLIKKCLAEAE
ncbi:MAG: sugar phosphate isomerase/epimerase family protein [Eubacteriales bacterium]